MRNELKDILKITTGIVVKRTIKGDRFVNVKFHSNNQTKKCIKGNPLDKDEREQFPLIKKGTEVLVIYNQFSFYAIASIGQGIKLVEKEITLIENEEVEILTDLLTMQTNKQSYISKTHLKTKKLAISNENNEVMSVISEALGLIIDFNGITQTAMSMGDRGGITSLLGSYKAELKANQDKMKTTKSKLDTFKE